MDHIGIDVHKKESQICILAARGELIERRIRTEPRASLPCWGSGRGPALCSRPRRTASGWRGVWKAWATR